MKIKVKSLQGDEFDLEVQNDQLVSSLKASISDNPKAPPVERQKLVYKGRTMLDTNQLREYNIEEGCKLHLIIQKDPKGSVEMTETTNENEAKLSRFEIILRERLAKHFTSSTVEKILSNLQHEIDADLNSSSLEDLERLAKKNLNIRND